MQENFPQGILDTKYFCNFFGSVRGKNFRFKGSSFNQTKVQGTEMERNRREVTFLESIQEKISFLLIGYHLTNITNLYVHVRNQSETFGINTENNFNFKPIDFSIYPR